MRYFYSNGLEMDADDAQRFLAETPPIPPLIERARLMGVQCLLGHPNGSIILVGSNLHWEALPDTSAAVATRWKLGKH